jgi:hypothetical protein
LIVAFSQKNPFCSESRAHEPPIFDEYSMQSNNLVQRKWSFARLDHCARPSFKPSSWRPFAFNSEAGSAVS